MISRGYDVTVLTNIPNYPQGKFFDGYSLFKKRREVIDGIKIIRVPIIPRGNGGKIRILLNYASGLLFMWIYALHYALWHKFDFIFVQQLSPCFIGLPATLVKRIQKIPIVYWLLDLWPDSLVVGGINSQRVYNIVSKITKHIYKFCNTILVSSKSFKTKLLERGVEESKIGYLPNWFEEVDSCDYGGDIPELPKGFRIMFAGNIGDGQNFENIMQTTLLLRDQKSIKWIIVGDGRKKRWVESFIKNNNLTDTVLMIGRYPIESMPLFFEQADVMLVSTCNESISTLPAKVQSYMANSKAIIGMISGEGNLVITNSQSGHCVDANDVDGMANLVLEMSQMSKKSLSEMGLRGKRYYDENFNKTKCMTELFSHIDKVLY